MPTTLFQFQRGIAIFLQAVSVAIVVYTLLRWIVKPGSPILQMFGRLLEPIIGLVRPIAKRLMANGFMFDLSPLLALLLIQVIQWIINVIFSWFW